MRRILLLHILVQVYCTLRAVASQCTEEEYRRTRQEVADCRRNFQDSELNDGDLCTYMHYTIDICGDKWKSCHSESQMHRMKVQHVQATLEREKNNDDVNRCPTVHKFRRNTEIIHQPTQRPGCTEDSISEAVVNFQSCSHQISSNVYEEIIDLTAPHKIVEVLCHALNDISKQCPSHLRSCYAPKDAKHMVRQHLAETRKFFERLAEDRLPAGAFESCKSRRDNRQHKHELNDNPNELTTEANLEEVDHNDFETSQIYNTARNEENVYRQSHRIADDQRNRHNYQSSYTNTKREPNHRVHKTDSIAEIQENDNRQSQRIADEQRNRHNYGSSSVDVVRGSSNEVHVTKIHNQNQRKSLTNTAVEESSKKCSDADSSSAAYNFQACSHTTASEVYEILIEIESPEAMLKVVCEALDKISNECPTHLQLCFKPKDIEHMTTSLIAQSKKMFVRLVSNRVPEEAINSCSTTNKISLSRDEVQERGRNQDRQEYDYSQSSFEDSRGCSEDDRSQAVAEFQNCFQKKVSQAHENVHEGLASSATANIICQAIESIANQCPMSLNKCFTHSDVEYMKNRLLEESTKVFKKISGDRVSSHAVDACIGGNSNVKDTSETNDIHAIEDDSDDLTQESNELGTNHESAPTSHDACTNEGEASRQLAKYQTCTQRLASSLYARVNSQSSPKHMVAMLCQTLQNISKICSHDLDACFDEETRRQVIYNTKEDLKNVFIKLYEDKVPRYVLNSCIEVQAHDAGMPSESENDDNRPRQPEMTHHGEIDTEIKVLENQFTEIKRGSNRNCTDDEVTAAVLRLQYCSHQKTTEVFEVIRESNDLDIVSKLLRRTLQKIAGQCSQNLNHCFSETDRETMMAKHIDETKTLYHKLTNHLLPLDAFDTKAEMISDAHSVSEDHSDSSYVPETVKLSNNEDNTMIYALPDENNELITTERQNEVDPKNSYDDEDHRRVYSIIEQTVGDSESIVEPEEYKLQDITKEFLVETTEGNKLETIAPRTEVEKVDDSVTQYLEKGADTEQNQDTKSLIGSNDNSGVDALSCSFLSLILTIVCHWL